MQRAIATLTAGQRMPHSADLDDAPYCNCSGGILHIYGEVRKRIKDVYVAEVATCAIAASQFSVALSSRSFSLGQRRSAPSFAQRRRA